MLPPVLLLGAVGVAIGCLHVGAPRTAADIRQAPAADGGDPLPSPDRLRTTRLQGVLYLALGAAVVVAGLLLG